MGNSNIDRAAAVAQLKDVYRILSDDMELAVAHNMAHPSPFSHRTVVSAFYSLVEGLAFQLRQVTVASLEPHPGHLTTAELVLLREERYSLNDKGETEVSDRSEPVPKKLLFTLKCYGKCHGTLFKPRTDQHGWNALKRAVRIRNRVTHPKSASDLTVGTEDQQILADAYLWWKETISDMFHACDKADAEWQGSRVCDVG